MVRWTTLLRFVNGAGEVNNDLQCFSSATMMLLVAVATLWGAH